MRIKIQHIGSYSTVCNNKILEQGNLEQIPAGLMGPKPAPPPLVINTTRITTNVIFKAFHTLRLPQDLCHHHHLQLLSRHF